jgi:hypothetical protein
MAIARRTRHRIEMISMPTAPQKGEKHLRRDRFVKRLQLFPVAKDADESVIFN